MAILPACQFKVAIGATNGQLDRHVIANRGFQCSFHYLVVVGRIRIGAGIA
jgi:hypothetical protein